MAEQNHATVGCAFATEDAAIAALQALANAGLVTAWRVGAGDKARAMKIAATIGGVADLDALDPLSGVRGLASGTDAASGVNSGAVIGGVIGAAVGFAAGMAHIASIMPVPPSLQTAAATLLFFVVGAALGGVLGGAFGKRPSTHAGFRLIDAMEAGDVAAIGAIDGAGAEEVRRLLEEKGAAEIIVIP